jgi:prepilin peptidase CpaA
MLMSVLLLAIGGVIVFAAVSDAATLTIPNWISLTLLGLFPLVALASGIGFAGAGLHLAIGFAALLIGMVLFAFNLVGGGDAKFLAAVSLYVGVPALMPFLFNVALAGGALAMVLMFAREVAAMGFSMDWFLKFTRGGSVIPYGIAIAFGALMVLPGSEIFSSTLS